MSSTDSSMLVLLQNITDMDSSHNKTKREASINPMIFFFCLQGLAQMVLKPIAYRIWTLVITAV